MRNYLALAERNQVVLSGARGHRNLSNCGLFRGGAITCLAAVMASPRPTDGAFTEPDIDSQNAPGTEC